jgi:hypothetical protein
MVDAALATIAGNGTAMLAAVPEPGSLGLLVVGIGGMILRRRRS